MKVEIEKFKAQNDSLGSEISKKDEIIKNQSRQIRKLTTIIADADEELRVQTKQYNAIVNEQRVLNQQLIKRNEGKNQKNLLIFVSAFFASCFLFLVICV